MEEILKYKTVTPGNIVRWYRLTPDITSGITSLNEKKINHSLPVFVPNEQYNLYLNLDERYGVLKDTQFTLYVQDMYGNDLAVLFSTVKKYLVNNIIQIYLSFKIPNYLGVGKLKLVGTGGKTFVSQNCLFGAKFVNNSNYFEFAHNRNIGSFYYADIIEKSNEVLFTRVRLLVVNDGIEFDQDVKQYRNATNRRLRNVNYDVDKIYKLKGRMMSDEDCDAFAKSISPCLWIYVNGIGLTTKSTLKTSKRDSMDAYTLDISMFENGQKSSYLPPDSEDFIDIIECDLLSETTINSMEEL